MKKKIIKSLIIDGFSISKFLQTKKLYSNLIGSERIRQANQKKFKVSIPPLCMFSVTWNCNLSCKGCYAINYKKGNTLHIGEIERVFQELNNYGTYVFILAGGEPLTIKELIGSIEKVNKGIYFLFTNGLLIDHHIILQLKRNKNIIPVISYEGEPYHTDERRGEDVSKRLSEIFKLLKDNRITYGISSMATHLNLGFVTSREYVDTIRKMGASFLYIIDYIPFEFSLNTDFILQKEDYSYKKNELLKRTKDSTLTIFNFPADEYADGVCEAGGKGFLHINANGYVEPCPFSHYAKDNILQKDYIEILKSDFLTKVRDSVEKIDNKTGNCLLFENKEMVIKIAEETKAFCTENSAPKSTNAILSAKV